ncbi:tetratricopeptide repeat protein [Phenylobacterium sp.]|uniref:glycosyltransferase family 9 protein n=1 Tax=Phenylobacterium sp. TaxID=1871053 RepID=UPI0025F55025|nr:tetratricopeptide repeat protein [Phenylobacterium sp.]
MTDARNAVELHNRAVALEDQGRLREAEAALREALRLAPDQHQTEARLGALLLSLGRLPEGFRHFEARHAEPRLAKPKLPFPEWRGEPLQGRRLLIWPEQGFGDQIQFARFAPLLRDQGAEITVLCRPGLERLFEQSLPGVDVRAAAGAVEFPDPDFWVMSPSLAGRLGVTLETLPNAPYLRAAGPAPDLPPGFRVGLVTAGNPQHANDANRSLPPAAAARLRALPASLVELDPAKTGARDFADTAAIVDALDLVITVDTSVAHLAGALGKPCWVLLPAIKTDWRWLRGRTDSPWYPSIRLYRQTVAGDWGDVLAAVERDLEAQSLLARATPDAPPAGSPPTPGRRP